jgi:hypothetical protein
VAYLKGALFPLEKDSFGYTAGTWGYTWHVKYQLDPGGLVYKVSTEATAHINASGLRDSIVYGWVQGSTLPTQYERGAAIRYGSNGKPARRLDYLFNYGSYPVLLVDSINYYYETYPPGPTLGIQTEAISLSVVPNPGNGHYSVHLSGVNDSKSTNIYVTDAMGRVLYSTRRAQGRGNAIEIELDNKLAPGSYFLQVQDGEQWARAVIIKL